MPTGRQIALDDAAHFLEERYGSVTGLEVLTGGEWSKAFGFVRDGEDLVLRFGLHREDYEADLRAAGYASDELPVPPVLEIGEAFGGVYAISERRYGIPLETLDETAWTTVLPFLFAALDRLREVPPPEATSDWRDDLLQLLEDRPGERVSGWRNGLAEHADAEDVWLTGRKILSTLLERCPEDRHVVHADLLYKNVLVNPGGRGITAFFDWGCSMGVDFMYEIAGLTFWDKWYSAMQAANIAETARRHFDEIGLAVPDFDVRLRACELHIGLLHIGYSVFADRPITELDWITARTKEVLGALG